MRHTWHTTKCTQCKCVVGSVLGKCTLAAATVLFTQGREHFHNLESSFLPFPVTHLLADHSVGEKKRKSNFFLLFSFITLPTRLCLLFSLFCYFSRRLAICWIKALSCLLALLTRREYASLFSYCFSMTSHSSVSEILIHPTHPSIHLSIHLSKLCWTSAMKHGPPNILSPLDLGSNQEDKQFNNYARKVSVYSKGKVWHTMGDSAGVAGNDSQGEEASVMQNCRTSISESVNYVSSIYRLLRAGLSGSCQSFRWQMWACSHGVPSINGDSPGRAGALDNGLGTGDMYNGAQERDNTVSEKPWKFHVTRAWMSARRAPRHPDGTQGQSCHG